ncbi:MAG: hypothetical protein ACLVCW_05740 [Campylobacter sp.]
MRKFGRLNGLKAERGKRAKRGGAGRINEMCGSRKELQNLAASKRTHQNRAISGVNLRRAARLRH